MSAEFEVIRCKGSVFRDFGRANADAEHLKAILASQIIKVLDKRELTVRAAEEVTGIAAATSHAFAKSCSIGSPSTGS